MNKNLYNIDFHAWILQQKSFLHNKEFDKLDLVNLEDEIEGMAKTERRELKNRLLILLIHLLKWKYQPTHRGASWEKTIKIQRLDLKDHLEENPSLRNPEYMDTVFNYAYKKAIMQASEETGLDEKLFLKSCEWTISQILDEAFIQNKIKMQETININKEIEVAI